MKSKYPLFCFSLLFVLHQPVQANGVCDSPHLISDFNPRSGTLQVHNVDVDGTSIGAEFNVLPNLDLDLKNFATDTGPLDKEINVFDQLANTLELGCINVDAIRYSARFGFSEVPPLFNFQDAAIVVDPSETEEWIAQWGPSCDNLTDSDDMIFNKDHSAQIGTFEGAWDNDHGLLTINLFGGSEAKGEISPDGIVGDFKHLNEDNCFRAKPKNSSAPLNLFNNGRFKVVADWRNSTGSSGQATHIKLTGESGTFFLGDVDAKIYIRVLDNCAVTNHFWVFAAATTNVEYTLTVADTQSNTTKVYFNPLGTASPAIIDTSAFATCP